MTRTTLHKSRFDKQSDELAGCRSHLEAPADLLAAGISRPFFFFPDNFRDELSAVWRRPMGPGGSPYTP